MKELEARKKLLVVECELYRQVMRLEIHNLRLYKANVRRRFAVYFALKPVLPMILPFVTSLFSRQRETLERKRLSFVSSLIRGWRMYKELRPLIAEIMGRFDPGCSSQPAEIAQTKSGEAV